MTETNQVFLCLSLSPPQACPSPGSAGRIRAEPQGSLFANLLPLPHHPLNPPPLHAQRAPVLVRSGPVLTRISASSSSSHSHGSFPYTSLVFCPTYREKKIGYYISGQNMPPLYTSLCLLPLKSLQEDHQLREAAGLGGVVFFKKYFY